MKHFVIIAVWIRKKIYNYFLKNEFKRVLGKNQNNQPLFYFLGDSGYGSEVFYLIWAKIFCKKFNIPFVLISELWNQSIEKGWKDFFEVSDNYIEESSLKEFRSINNVKESQQFSRSYTYRNPFTIKRYLLGSDIWSLLRSKKYLHYINRDEFLKVYRTICAPNENLKLKLKESLHNFPFENEPYIALLGRRGDKVKETQPVTADEYVKEIEKHEDVSKNLFIATDDITIVNEIKDKLEKHWQVFSYASKDELGYDNNKFNKTSKKEKKKKVEKMLLNIKLLAKGDIFIGTASSNSYHIVALERDFKDCFSLDKMIDYEYFIKKLWSLNENS